MLLPPVSFNIYFSYAKEQMIERLQSDYSEVLRAYSVKLSKDSSKNLEEISRVESVFMNQIKSLEVRVNQLNAFLDKRKKWEDFLKVLLNIFEDQNRTLYLDFSQEKAIVEFYEVSKNVVSSTFQNSNVSTSLLFEEKLPEGFYLRKYRLEYKAVGK